MALVFGYLSLLRSDSIQSSLTKTCDKPALIPVKLHGYIRSWTSFRRSSIREAKNYVTLDCFDVAPYHTWATLKEHTGWVNGLCFHINDAELVNLDAREIGYQRMDVTDMIIPYDGFSLPNERVFTYIAPSLDVSNLTDIPWISADYVNMGFEGALAADQGLPGFYRDYVASTLPCESLIRNVHQVFWDNSGSKLYILDERDSSVIMVHDFNMPTHHSMTGHDIHCHAPISKGNAHKDHRYVINSKSGVYFNAMSTTGWDDIDALMESTDPWVHIYLSKNPKLTSDQKKSLYSKNNFVVNVIMDHQ